MHLNVFFRPLVYLSLVALAACSSTAPSPSAKTAEVATTAHSLVQPTKIGIALGGDAAKGFAHISVIKMLEANGFILP